MEDLFSDIEWHAIVTGDFSEIDDELELSRSPDGGATEAHEVTIYDPPGGVRRQRERLELECDRCGTSGQPPPDRKQKR